MSSLTRGMWTRRKIVVIFLIGILAPSLIVGYLSWRAFSQRRDAIRQVIESQLWIAGETAAEAIESSLQEYESKILSPENFSQLSSLSQHLPGADSPRALNLEKTFLLDADFRVLSPQTGSDDTSPEQWDWSLYDSPFSSLFQRAEHLEFTLKKLRQAAELYARCVLSTPTDQLKALALEGRGRCLTALAEYEGAFQVYQELLNKYARFRNRVGHPYGLLAAVRSYDIARTLKSQKPLMKSLLDTLDRLRNGEWLLSGSTFGFYVEQLERILQAEIGESGDTELLSALQAIREKPSPYLEELEFKRVLEENVIPILRERIAFSQYSNESQKGRLPLTLDGGYFLVSYTRLSGARSDQAYYAGFFWDLDYIKNRKLPEIAAAVALTTGIQVRVIDEGVPNQAAASGQLIPKDALSLTSRQFPFPWRFIVTQSALEDLKSAALRDNIFHGVLLAVILGLMSLGALLISRDISREAEIMRQKTEFVHNISHELRTPLTLIRLFGETLQDKKNLSEETKSEAYEIITRESERLSHMINNVLDFSRIEMGKKEFNLQTGDLAETVRETLGSYRCHLEKKGFVVHEDIPAGLPPLHFDREAMASVLINLLSNAMKFSPEIKEVFVRLACSEDGVVLQVRDRGIGISRQDLAKIFGRFYRSKSSSPSDSGGSGLGLTIIKHIAEAHGGRIEVKSEPGKGSDFTVWLPLTPKKEEAR